MKSFQSFHLDTVNHILLREEERLPLTPKAFDVLRYLVERAGRLVTQEELLEELWPETYVNQEVLRKYILEIRKALGDKADKPEFVETVTKRGYRFVAPVIESDDKALVEFAKKQDVSEDARPSDEAERFQSPTPATQERSFIWLIPVVAAFIATAIVVGYFWLSRSRESVASRNDTSLAVLPFADLSPAKDQEYFSDGLTEELISDLAKTSGLKVVARSSAFQFKGKNEDLRSVGKKLGVANVLEGSIRKEGDHVRITAELTKVGDGFQLWSETYDRELTNIFSTQDEIAIAVTAALRVKLLLPAGSNLSEGSPTTNPAAYQAYLQGQYFSARGQDKEDLSKALSYADQAIQLDPSYAPAWAQRAQVLQTMASVALIDHVDGFRRASENAQKAIALDPKLASGYLALGMVQINHDFDWEGADASLRKAASLAPGSVDVLRYQAYLARTLGHVDESIGLYKQAIALDPLRANFHLALGYELYLASRFDEAQNVLRRAQELNPQLSSLHLTFGKIFLAQNRPQQALEEMAYETGDWEKLSGESLAYFAVGRRQDSDGSLNKLIARHQNDGAYQIAEVYAYRGETNRAFEWLDRAYRQHDPGTQELKTGLLVKSLRQDPRYAELLKKMRLPMSVSTTVTGTLCCSYFACRSVEKPSLAN
jgi:TolB-like protein/DNA-binding winged helix-turn-helix (wHTH) protein/Tfp pilus assembly protein PilF